MATQIQEGELDCTNASRGVWLVKVPKYISQRWDKAPGNIEVGKLRIARTPSGQKSGQSGRPKLDVSFSLSEAVLAMEKSEAIPKDHKFVISNVNNQTLGVFSQTTPPANSNAVVPETEKLMMEGRVIQRAECKPEGSETYMKLKLEGFRKSAVPARMAKRLDDVVHVKPVANHRYNVEFTQKKKSEGKKVRDDKDKVMNVLFAAFEKHQYYNIKDLAGITRQPVAYLAKYGYISSSSGDGRTSALRSLENDIAEFQRFAGLNVTGELDQATLEKMRQPRCGVKDKIGPSTRSRRRKRYALQGSRWRTRDIKYKIESWPSSVTDKSAVREVIRKSFQVWADVSSLSFREVGPYEKAQIVIRFARGDHGDGDPFDGRGGTLAHAFFPLYGGDAHFDDSERWSAGDSLGTDIFMTASHEFGHSLGLSHSDDQRSLMAPFYKSPPRDGGTNVLREDDVLGIQALYGPAQEAPTPPENRPTTRRPLQKAASGEDPILCADGTVDAMITAGSQKQTYVFKGAHYWRLTDTGIEKGYPRLISHYWKGVPDDIDAAFSWPQTNRIYFFKGNKYWRMTSFKMDPGYPKLMSEGFRGIPFNVDAAFRWTGNGKIYFFKGDQYWKFDPSRGSEPVSSSYPQPVSNWGNLPGNLDAAVTYSNGRSYFFKKGYYYRFDDARFQVDEADPPYPRPAGYWWFGCKSQSSSLRSGLDAGTGMSRGGVSFSQRRTGAGPSTDDDVVMAFGDENVPDQARNTARRPADSGWRLAAGLLLTAVLVTTARSEL